MTRPGGVAGAAVAMALALLALCGCTSTASAPSTGAKQSTAASARAGVEVPVLPATSASPTQRSMPPVEPAPSPRTTSALSRTTGPPVDQAVQNEIAQAIAAVEGSWQETVPQWEMPTIWHGDGLYDSAGRDLWRDDWRDGPPCGGEAAVANNAFYCPGNDTVAWDLALIENDLNSTGPLFIEVLVAHEIAHAVQSRLTKAGQGYLVWREKELQADCIAGAFLAKANVAGRIDIQPDGVDQMIATFVSIGDAEAWIQPGNHGDASQRWAAFDDGHYGIERCIGPAGPPAYPDPVPATVRTSLITPSGNIRCVNTGITLKCAIRDYDFPSTCPDGGRPLISMDVIDPPTADSCAGLSLEGLQLQPVEYGDQVDMGDFSCSVQESGLSCRNSAGHGFELSRASMQLN